MYQSILEKAKTETEWISFLDYKLERQHLSKQEETEIRNFIEKKAFLPLCALWEQNAFPATLPIRRAVNKEGTKKKRIVYSFPGEEGIFLKFIAYHLFAFDDVFSKNCYAFRRGYGVKDAIRRLRTTPGIRQKYCLKIDVSNYFNSIDVDILLKKLDFVEKSDPKLFRLLQKILKEDRVINGDSPSGNHDKSTNTTSPGILTDSHGAMAGTPISPFFANVYLSELDYLFEELEIPYFRYSDDILLFAETMADLQYYRERLEAVLTKLRLSVNPEKVTVTAPGEVFEFLGFSYHEGEIDLSANTIRKMKAKIKRKAEALRRWQRKKNLSADKAAIGFIRAMNYKFFGDDSDEFSWNRWFFPNLTTDAGLKEIDAYMQEYIRYAVTGRHYKGNYRIRYDQLKKWGYRNLVHEFYASGENSAESGKNAFEQ